MVVQTAETDIKPAAGQTEPCDTGPPGAGGAKAEDDAGAAADGRETTQN